MLEIKPIQTKEEQREICGLCGVEFIFDCLAYSAKENNVLLGVLQFRILGEYAVIYDLAYANAAVTNGKEDADALIIMGKAALNFIDSCGVKDVIIKTENMRNKNPHIPDNVKNIFDIIKILEFLKFKEDSGGVYKLNLDGYFDSPCRRLS